MACLVPQFKCPPDIFAIHFTAHNHHLFKARQPVCFRAQCLLTTTAAMPTATVVDMAKLHLPTLESHSHSVAADRSLTYMGSTGPPSKTSFKAALVTETLTGEEAVVAAAAAEAVALAKAAVEVAKSAASMIGYNPSIDLGYKPAKPESNDFWFERAGLIDTEQAISLHSVEAEAIPEEEHSVHISTNVEDNLDPTDEELKLLEMQLSKSVAVRSGRQTERKVKRSKAAEKAASSVVSVNTGTSSRKKRPAAQEVDYADPLHYFRMVGSSKLLTSNEEMQLSEGIQVLLKLETLRNDLVERYGEEPTFAQWAAAAGIDQKTLRKSINFGTYCKDKMIKCNIRLVISIAKNYVRAGMGFSDLVQEGCRGLVRGAEKFDAAKGFKFSTYAHWWIKQAVRKSLSDRSRTIRLPFHMVEATYRVKDAKRQLLEENGRDPSVQEIADATGLSMKRLQAVLLTPKPPLSLDQKFGLDGTLKLSDITADPNAETSEVILNKKCMREDLDKVLGTLNSREKQVIRWRFGLEDGRMKTLQEIGELMGVSRERIRQIESCAFRKLKNKKRTKNLQQYMVSST